MSPSAPSVEAHMRIFYQSLSEKDRRRYAAIEVHKLDHGGRSSIARVLGCTHQTILQDCMISAILASLSNAASDGQAEGGR